MLFSVSGVSVNNVWRWWEIDEKKRPLDAADINQIIVALQTWINGLINQETKLPILGDHLWLEYGGNSTGLGYYIRPTNGVITSADILNNYSAAVSFKIYCTTSAVPDGIGTIYKPLNDLSNWFKAYGTAGLSIGEKRKPEFIATLKGPVDLKGRDENGKTTFFATFQLKYYEEAI